jgi:hypothetical protein
MLNPRKLWAANRAAGLGWEPAGGRLLVGRGFRRLQIPAGRWAGGRRPGGLTAKPENGRFSGADLTRGGRVSAQR